MPGDGEYELQPIFVEDLADLAVEHGRGKGNIVLDAVGPEVYSLNDLVRLIGQVVHSRTIVVHVNPQLALIGTGLMGRALKDVVLTRDEVEGLRANLLVSSAPPTGRTRLSDWLRQNAEWIGREYMSELGRHYP